MEGYHGTCLHSRELSALHSQTANSAILTSKSKPNRSHASCQSHTTTHARQTHWRAVRPSHIFSFEAHLQTTCTQPHRQDKHKGGIHIGTSSSALLLALPIPTCLSRPRSQPACNPCKQNNLVANPLDLHSVPKILLAWICTKRVCDKHRQLKQHGDKPASLSILPSI